MAEHFGLDNDNLPADAFPLQCKMIAREHNNDKQLILKSNFHMNAFCGGGEKQEPICQNDKIVIPTTLYKNVVDWYHTIALYAIPVKRAPNR